MAARNDQVGLWILRAVLLSEEYEDVYSGNFNDRIMRGLGMAVPADREELKPSEVRRMIERRIAQLEKMKSLRVGTMFENVEQLGQLLGLDRVERELVAFAAALSSEEPLANCFSELCLGMSVGSPSLRLHTAVTKIIEVPVERVREALAPTSTLVATGLIRVGGERRRWESASPLVLMGGLAAALLREQQDANRLMDTFFRPGRATSLTREDFLHVEGSLGLLARFVAQVSREGRAGVNVLLYGPAGTGKTELSRLLAAELELPCFEVSVEDEEEEPLQEHERLTAYRVSQRVLARGQPCLVIFDEVEDVLPREVVSLFGIDTGRGYHKGFMHRLLEENPVPAIWVTNKARHLDPALLRRFSFVMELEPPPRRTRRRMLGKCCEDLALDGRMLDRVASNRHLTPADMERAAGVVRTLGTKQPMDAERVFLEVLNSGLSMRGQAGSTAEPQRYLDYDPRLVSASHYLAEVARGLAQAPEPRGRLLLYGPPGTGKTAWVHHLARELDCEVMIRRASDLLSKWVGESEQNIARMFRRAAASGDVLLLDEADSFLRDREHARQSWQVTQVNELLVQLEGFDGVFVASTNLLDKFDRAAYRRFDLKVEFDYLDRNQRYVLLENMLAALPDGAPNASLSTSLRRRLDHLDRLTPGDAALVMRRLAFFSESLLDDAPTEVLLAALEEEHAAKPGAARRPVGFGVSTGPPRRNRSG